MTNIKETDLYQPIYNYFTDLGYKVDGEVKTLDVTATKDDELIVVELKKSLNMKLLIQGSKRQRLTDMVYLAIPRPKKTFSREWKDKIYLTRRLELGLIVVSFNGDKSLVQIIHHPKPFSREQSKRISTRKKNNIIREVEGRNNNYNIGGSKGKKLMTAYKENSLHIACCLQKHGTLSTRELRELGTGAKTTSILYKNFYKWFTKVGRGVYELNEVGKNAIDEYKDLANYYFKLIEEKGAKSMPNNILNDFLIDFRFTGKINDDVNNLLLKHNKKIIAEHVIKVANTAKILAKRFEVDCKKAEIAGYLHDISGIIANDNKIDIAQKLKIDILEEENECPLVIHQKLSRVIASKLFDIEDEEILSAIECHTTLKSNPTRMDMIVFIADKISWDQKGQPPYLNTLNEELNKSLEHGVFSFISYQWSNKDKLKVVHPWLKEAYEYFYERL